MATLAICTSGGDSPGMNAAVRAFCRAALTDNHRVIAIQNGYQGILDEQFFVLTPRDLGMIINLGGTFLGTSRSKNFSTPQGLGTAANHLHKKDIEALCVVGGDGSFRGLMALSEHFNGKVFGIPGTIDNDIPGTAYTIGYDTAIETAVWAIDNIRDTAHSHGRIFLIEVMGRKSGQIAISVALASGAEEVMVPEHDYNIERIAERLKKGHQRGKRFSIIIVAEGAGQGALEISKQLKEDYDLETKVAILGHIQRGGTPTAYERLMATQMGAKTYQFFKDGLNRVFCSFQEGELRPVPLEVTQEKVRTIDPDLISILRSLGN